jgi:pSer/pThr/pTyr-binding forkhead associated (FHA) protein
MSPGLLLLILRILMVVVLLGFLLMILMTLRQDLRQQVTRTLIIPKAHLVLLGETHARNSYHLSNVNLIGRAADNTIVLHEEVVSAHHARLSYLSGLQWWLEDLGSRNGTSVNGIPIEQPLAVTNGDELAFGTVSFRLDVEAAGTENDTQKISAQENAEF